MTTRSARGRAVFPVKTLAQIVGGRTWSLSLIRLDDPCRTEDWLPNAEEHPPTLWTLTVVVAASPEISTTLHESHRACLDALAANFATDPADFEDIESALERRGIVAFITEHETPQA